jgi:hypothetical protein
MGSEEDFSYSDLFIRPNEVNMEEFYELLQGKEEILGGNLTFEKAQSWLESGDKEKKGTLCLIFSEKPLLFMIKGITKHSGKGDNIELDKKLYKYLPLLSEEEFSSIDVQDKVKLMKARSLFPEELRMLNVTMIRNVSLIFLQENFSNNNLNINKTVKSWFDKYKTSPLEMNESDLYIQSVKDMNVRKSRSEVIKRFQIWYKSIQKRSGMR